MASTKRREWWLVVDNAYEVMWALPTRKEARELRRQYGNDEVIRVIEAPRARRKGKVRG